MKPKFISLTAGNKKCTTYSKSGRNKVMISNDVYEIIQELSDLLLHKYQIDLEQSTRGSNFIFDYVSGMHYIRNMINLNRDGLYIDSPKWLKNKKVTINPKDHDNKYFQYAIAVALTKNKSEGIQREEKGSTLS